MPKVKSEIKLPVEKIEVVIEKPHNFAQNFLEFLQKFGVIGLALGVVIGAAVKTLVDSLVANILNPILAKIIGQVNLSGWEFYGIKIGSFTNDVINFIILMFVVYLAISFFIKKFLTEADIKKLNI